MEMVWNIPKGIQTFTTGGKANIFFHVINHIINILRNLQSDPSVSWMLLQSLGAFIS